MLWMIGVDSVLSRSNTNAVKKMRDNGVAGRNRPMIERTPNEWKRIDRRCRYRRRQLEGEVMNRRERGSD